VRGGGQAETRKTFKREMGGEQHKAIGRSRSKSKSHEQHRKASKTEVSTMTRAVTSESTVPESSEERRLWKERAARGADREEGKDDRQHATAVEVGMGSVREANEIQREVDELREEITLVDREIRVAEKDACIKGSEGAKAIELAAKEAKEFAYALEQARQRKKEAEQTISELEAKVKEACRA
jgi:hypothetical protein